METPLEVEVKFLVADLAAVRERLLTIGGAVKKPRIFERNVRFDTPNDTLRDRFELLRLRQDTAVRVTFKGPSDAQSGSEARVREEWEMEVSDFETAATIFERLGFPPQQTYEKYRTTFQLGDVEVVLDEMPFGEFVELEGPEAALKTVAEQLGLDWRRRILTNYLTLMAQLKALHHLSFDDITFGNFENLDVSAGDLFGDDWRLEMGD
jgi:adenylate cyclase class 2